MTHDTGPGFTPGDTILFARDGRWYEPLTFTSSGNSSNPISISSYGSGSLPVISAAELRTGFASLGWTEVPDGLYYTGFESGTTTEFNSTSISTGNSLLVSSSTVHQGQFSLETVSGGDNAQRSARVNRNFTVSDDVYARAYFYFPNDFSIVNANQRVDVMYLKFDSITNRVRVSILENDSGELYIQGRIEAPTAQTFYGGTPGEIQRGQWHQIEVRYKGNDAETGGSELWLDGVSLGPDYSFDTTALTVGRFELGPNTSSQTVPTVGSKIFIDNMKVSTTTVGPFMSEGDPDIYAINGVNWTIRHILADNVQLESVASFDEISQNTFFRNTSNNRLFVQLAENANPNSKNMELSRYNSAIAVTGTSYITVSNIQTEANNNTSFGGFSIINSNNILVDEVVSTKNFGSGILIDNGSNFNTVRRSQLLANDREFGGAVRIQNNSHDNIIEQNVMSGLINGVRSSNGVFVRGSDAPVNRNIIRYNLIRDMSDSGVYLNTDANENQVYGNVIFGIDDRLAGTSGGNGIHVGNITAAPGYTRGNIIHNNLVYDVATHGISLREGAYENVIYNNTVFNVGVNRGDVSGNVASGSGISLHSSSNTVETGAYNNRIFNNIVSTCATACLAVDIWSVAAGGNEINNNIYFNPLGTLVRWNGVSYTTISPYQLTSGQDSESLQADPRFTNSGANDFTLLSDSPAIDAGTTTLGSEFRFGFTSGSAIPEILALANQDEFGSGWEIGAFVYNIVVAVVDAIKRSSGAIVSGLKPNQNKDAATDFNTSENGSDLYDEHTEIIPGMTRREFIAVWNQLLEIEKNLTTFIREQYTVRYRQQFNRNIERGAVGNDVLLLQQYLNNAGYILTSRGVGSPGQETIFFGNATTLALREYQRFYGLPVTGLFDTATREQVINTKV